ncbi:MAG TPA: hypothetical protein PKD85_18555, partial [Saprospiraceae bacterium]|nr:hypothetical protein [Saprospiraceae bacterium]
ITKGYKFTFNYDNMGNVMNEVKALDILICEKHFETYPFIIVKIRQSLANGKIKMLKAKLLGISLDRIEDQTQVNGLTIEQLDS